jgi:hypothetical protein
MANIDTPIPGSSLIFFFFITLGFLIFTLFSIQSAKSIEDIEKAKDGSMLTIIYVCILVIGSYFINTTVSKALCNSQAVRWTDILLATLLPWIIIFFSLFMILKIFPGWITPFSNTVGYLVISILGVETTLTNILNSNVDVGDDLAKAIANITHNKSNFINQIDINKTTFLIFINDLINAKIITLVEKPDKAGATEVKAATEGKAEGADGATGAEGATGAGARAAEAEAAATDGAPASAPAGAKRPEIDKAILTNSDIQNLYKLLVIKNVLGQITWYVLAGVLVSSVSYNYIINMSCDKSLEEITADLNNAEAKSLEYAQGS